MFSQARSRVILILATQALNFIKSSQQIPAVMLWSGLLFMLVGFSLISLQGPTGPTALSERNISYISIDNNDILKIYFAASLILYILSSILRAVRAKKYKSALYSKMKKALIISGVLFALILAFIPFLEINSESGAGRLDIFLLVLMLQTGALLTTLYAIAIAHGINALVGRLHERYGEQG